jgi:hypothetical protein
MVCDQLGQLNDSRIIVKCSNEVETNDTTRAWPFDVNASVDQKWKKSSIGKAISLRNHPILGKINHREIKSIARR